MKPAIKKKWVEALRSGDYKQTDGYLRSGDEYCCLGVLCEGVLGLKPVAMDDGFFGYRGTEHGKRDLATGALLESHKKRAGLGESQYDLIRLNDGGYSFEAIANYIEEKL